MAQPPSEHRFAAPGGDLCWFEWGQPGVEPSLLLLHATGFHARCWDQVVAALPGDRHIVAVDLPGHGRSFRPETLGDWMTIGNAAGAFVSAQFDRPVFGVGHSMGGYLAVRLAAKLPQAFSGLLLVDPVIMPPAAYQQTPRQLMVAEHPVARRRNRWDSADQMITHFAARPPYASWRPDVLADYCRFGLVKAADGEGLELACPPQLEASAYMGSAGNNPHAMLDQVHCPVTVLRARNGERGSTIDFSISPTWPELASALPNAVDLHWSDLSHFIPMEAPDRLAGLIIKTMG